MYRTASLLGAFVASHAFMATFDAASFHKANAKEQRRCTAVSLRSLCEINIANRAYK
jgi:hypothetical protein